MGILQDGWTWIGVTIAAVLAVYFSEVIKSVLPSPDNLVRFFRRPFSRAPLDTHFTILICDLAGDDAKRTQTHHVIAAFRGQKGISTVPLNRTLRIDSYAPHDEAEVEAEAQGRLWLRENKADVLIWGEVAKVDETLRLWFLPSDGNGSLGAPAYHLEKTELPKNFHADLAAQLVAVALTALKPVTERAGEFLVVLLRPIADKLRRLIANPLRGFTQTDMAAANHSLGLAAFVIGEQAGENDSLEEAVAAYRAVLGERTRERVPLDWAMTQNNLGNALMRLGGRESGTARVEEEAVAYEDALGIFVAEDVVHHASVAEPNLERAKALLAARQGHLGGASS